MGGPWTKIEARSSGWAGLGQAHIAQVLSKRPARTRPSSAHEHL
ncbi:hypothetical protein CCACVL1_22665 [Corchorus capsularis]|uniref:Uncharacterized protein n=1 Tax=Corchorus capsularis TaxID=210143 RepID=A0A1R3GXB6_COCAP|nr:hypothetical protein CCACVL1_22665 [Corchorus capsularis]